MYIYFKFNGIVHQLVCGIYAFGAASSFVFVFINGDVLLLLVSLFLGLLAWIFYLLGKWSFDICERAENFDRFCEVHKLDKTKKYHWEFFSQYKKENK